MPFIVDSNETTKQEIRDVCAMSVFAAFADGDATPAVGLDGTFKTNNTIPVNITNFIGGYNGQRIIVAIDDVNTTIDFTSISLIGNGGILWSPSLGDSFTAVYDGTFWFCQLIGGYEASLGNPSVDGYILSSTIAGVRSWVAAGTGSSNNWLYANNGSNFTLDPIATGSVSIALGENSEASEDSTIAIGNIARADGFGNNSLGDNAVSIGDTVNYNVINNTSVGTDALASGDAGATAVGNGATASGLNSTAVGSYSVAQGEGTVAIGEVLAENDFEVRIGSTDNQLHLDATGKLSLIGTDAVYELPEYTVLTAPAVSAAGSGLIFVSNGAAGSPVMAFSDGTNWLRCDTLAAIS